MGQGLGAKPSGVHRSKGQTKSPKSLPGRRGLREPTYDVWDPLSQPQWTTKVGGVRVNC